MSHAVRIAKMNCVHVLVYGITPFAYYEGIVRTAANDAVVVIIAGCHSANA